ncbi:hypothetical protein SAMN02983003_3932 [Devosia enhydra]|uniref:Outer membrane protein beta-barrel domain-containing protein n=1 Tax=Devosia enhydra TaxID=665118 RepID=A0A1K2I2X0_9HYPH|nr:hypothetical protein [Devosia enhydra]SFZ86738.1 hypothetical protein SAMN02983003_3932 [Devosia enhydra]
MTKRFCALVAGLATLASISGALAQPVGVTPTSGIVSAFGGVLGKRLDNSGNDFGNADTFLAGAGGQLHHWLGAAVALQADFEIMASGTLDIAPDLSIQKGWYNSALHLAWRDPARASAAVFGALQGTTVRWSDGYTTSVPYGLAGIEAQAYLGDVTLYGQAGMAFDMGEPPNLSGAVARDYGDFAFVRGVLRYFPTENIRLSAEALYGAGEITYYTFNRPSVQVPTTIGSVKVSGDFRPDDSPLSYFGSYEIGINHQSIPSDTRIAVDHRLMAGVRVDMGAQSLKARDRSGVTWDVPDIAGLVAQGELLDYCFDVECTYYSAPP